jgi:ribosomal protein S18 acetylase RimI-like enzyme
MSSDDPIRPARADECAAIRTLEADAYRPYVARIGREPAPMSADYRALIARGVVYVLPGAAGPRGLLVAYPDGDTLFIENVAVSPCEQGRGLGRRLLNFAAELAATQNRAALTLYTNALMTENVHYYGKLGFVETARRTVDGFDRIYMRQDLAVPPVVG